MGEQENEDSHTASSPATYRPDTRRLFSALLSIVFPRPPFLSIYHSDHRVSQFVPLDRVRFGEL